MSYKHCASGIMFPISSNLLNIAIKVALKRCIMSVTFDMFIRM